MDCMEGLCDRCRQMLFSQKVAELTFRDAAGHQGARRRFLQTIVLTGQHCAAGTRTLIRMKHLSHLQPDEAGIMSPLPSNIALQG